MAWRGRNALKGHTGSGPNRSCGECRACCITLGFAAREDEAAFEKPFGEPCRHLVQIGCDIYAERPPVCRRFECGWLQAPNLPDELRPDRCGVLFAANDLAGLIPDGDHHTAIFAYELRRGASQKKLPSWLIGELSRETNVVIVREGGCEVLAFDPEVQAYFEPTMD